MKKLAYHKNPKDMCFVATPSHGFCKPTLKTKSSVNSTVKFEKLVWFYNEITNVCSDFIYHVDGIWCV